MYKKCYGQMPVDVSVVTCGAAEYQCICVFSPVKCFLPFGVILVLLFHNSSVEIELT